MKGHLWKGLSNGRRGALFYSTDPLSFLFTPVSFQGERLRKENACLVSMLGSLLLWSLLLEMEPSPGHWSRGHGEILRALIWGICMEMGRYLGCPGGGWGDKKASYSFPSGQGPGGGVSRPLGKRRRLEPEPLRRQKGKMEELGPPSAVRNQPEPQEQRERARLQRALQVQEPGGTPWGKWW